MHNHFLNNWDHTVNDSFINEINNHFESIHCGTLGDLSFRHYQKGIAINQTVNENGVYVFKLPNSFYVGKATSCTLIERLAKHFDSRKVGSFNGLLKKLSTGNLERDNFPENQEILMQARLLIIPINHEELVKKNANCDAGSCINHLEMDLIILLGQVFKLPTSNTKIKRTLSGSFF